MAHVNRPQAERSGHNPGSDPALTPYATRALSDHLVAIATGARLSTPVTVRLTTRTAQAKRMTAVNWPRTLRLGGVWDKVKGGPLKNRLAFRAQLFSWAGIRLALLQGTPLIGNRGRKGQGS
jgi:hypothetical protein